MKTKIVLMLSLVLALALGVKAYAGSDEVNADSAIVTMSESNFTAETAKGVVLVDFWAPWCGPCRKMNPILETVAAENKEVAKVGKVNVDDNKKLATDLKVSSIPTIVVFKDGKEVDRVIGVVTKEHLEKVIKVYTAK